MKKIACLLLALLFAGEHHILAQNNKEKKEKVTTLKLIQKENGEEIIIDTTFINADESAINAFLKAKGIKNSSKHTLPPIPPKVPGAPMPPVPPEPPSIDDEMQGLRYQYERKDDEGEEIDMELKDELAPLMQSLEEVKEIVKKSLEETKLSKVEIEKVMKEIEMDLKNQEHRPIRPTHKNERIIIKKKTGEIEHLLKDSDTGSNFQMEEPMSRTFVFSSSGLDEPIVLTTESNNKNVVTSYSYSYSDVKNEKHQKIKFFLKRLKDKILD